MISILRSPPVRQIGSTSQGLVHRDVKPANILLENGVERVRLTDFGLARAVDDASLTQSGVVAGTPQYMAPEQARGESIDYRADLFSLGSTLYAMCAGHPPFRADSALAVLRRVCDEEPRPLRAINADIPAWLVAIIDKLHSKEPTGRFQAAGEVADLLGRCLAHLQQPDTVPLPATVASPSVKAKRLRRRLRWATALTVILALGLGGALLWTPLGAYIFPANEGTASVGKRETGAQAHSRPSMKDDDRVQPQLEEVRGRTMALEADLTQRSVAGFGDPTDDLVRDVQRRLYVLKRELTETTVK